MYNRYVSQKQTYAPVSVPTKEEQKAPDEKKYIQAQGSTQAHRDNSVKNFSLSGAMSNLNLGKITELLDRDKSGAMGGLLSALKLEEVDSGDILLILILILLLMDGDDLELVITLGLMLLLGLGGKTKKDPDHKNVSESRGDC